MGGFKESNVREMSPVEAAWVGAMLEGEGSIVVRNDKQRGYDGIQIAIASTCMETLTRCQRFVGTGRIVKQSPRSAACQFGTKPVHYWVVAKQREVKSLLHQVREHLTGKQDKAEQALSLIHAHLTKH